jgi:putative salt-induced outer membrane protein YdiY
MDTEWFRDEFSGIKNRYSISSGVGHKWSDTDDLKFRTAYGLEYFTEEGVFEPADFDDSYAAGRLEYEYEQKIGSNGRLTQEMVSIFNLSETSDYRTNLKTDFATSISTRTALKVSLDLRYDSEPGFEGVQLFGPSGDVVGLVPFQLEELDTVFTIALSIKL